MRLARALAAMGVCARREAEEHIRAGRVRVNGAMVTEVATNVDPVADVIEHDGTRVFLERPTTLVLFKPEGVVTTVTDTHGRPTVRDLVPDVKERVYPVGRLDVDASGVLLLTNDGDLAYRLTHPKYEVKKTYRVTVEGRPTEDQLRRLARGVVMGAGERKTAPARVTLVRGVKGGAILRITIHEGRRHEIKRMCAKIGHPCTKLVREKFAGITLAGLSPGRYRQLSFKELRKLRRLVGLEVDVKKLLERLDRELEAPAEPVPPRETAAVPLQSPARERPPRRKPAAGKKPRRPPKRPERARDQRDRKRTETAYGPTPSPAPPPAVPPVPEPEPEPERKIVRRRVKKQQ